MSVERVRARRPLRKVVCRLEESQARARNVMKHLERIETVQNPSFVSVPKSLTETHIIDQGQVHQRPGRASISYIQPRQEREPNIVAVLDSLCFNEATSKHAVVQRSGKGE
jgi:hypothetical protein